MSYSRWAILLIFCAAAVLVLAMRWEASREDVRSARVARSEGREGLELHGGIDTNRMERHEALRVWLLFHNRSKSAIASLHFADWQMPGFTETGPCWLAHAPACVGSVRTGLPATLNAGESAVVTAEMKPASGSGRYAILSVVEWTNPAGGQLRTALTLGPVEITTWWHQGVLTFSRRARGLTTDFGLPVILLIAGWWLQRLQKEREQRLERAAREAHDRRAQEESQRKAAEDARTEKRTQMNAVLTTLLQGNLKDTQQYYLPFATRLSRLIRLLPGARQGTDRDRRLCVHALLAFLRQHKLLTDEIGGHHFQNRRGEVVASAAWAVFFVHLEQRLPIEARVPALKAFQPAMSPVDVMARMDAEDTAFVINPNKPRPLREAERLILDWVSTPQHPLETMLPLFSILHAVFAFEINRPFEYWYGSRWEFPVAALEEALSSLPAEPAKQVNRLKEELQSYIAEGRTWQAETA